MQRAIYKTIPEQGARETRPCGQCSEPITRYVSVNKNKRFVYCTTDCKRQHQRIIMLAVNNEAVRRNAEKMKTTMRGKNNPRYGVAHSSKVKKLISTKVKQQYAQGRVAWCKGLTKEDHPSLRKLSESMVELHKEKKVGMYGRKQSKRQRETMRAYWTGREGPLAMGWQGGGSLEPYPDSFNKKFKQKIKDRDNNKCVTCESTNRLSVHHIDYDKKNTTYENCITVCTSHNSRANRNREHWESFYKNKMKKILQSVKDQ